MKEAWERMRKPKGRYRMEKWKERKEDEGILREDGVEIG